MTTIEPGCYIDSHHGHYATPMVIQLANGFGFHFDDLVGYALANYDEHSHEEDFPNEALMEVSEEATDWLNANRPVDGHWWGWNEGDFGLYPIEEDD